VSRNIMIFSGRRETVHDCSTVYATYEMKGGSRPEIYSVGDDAVQIFEHRYPLRVLRKITPAMIGDSGTAAHLAVEQYFVLADDLLNEAWSDLSNQRDRYWNEWTSLDDKIRKMTFWQRLRFAVRGRLA